MKICKKEDSFYPKLIMGNLYQKLEDDRIYICAYQNRLICISDGIGFAADKGFGHHKLKWIDVTDKYCLKEI